MTFVYSYLLIGVCVVSFAYFTLDEDEWRNWGSVPLFYAILALLLTVALWPMAFLYKRKPK